MKQQVSLKSPGFTLIELLCVVAIIALLAGLLIPVSGTVMLRAKNIQCLNNLRQIGTAANAAATDNNGFYPIIAIDVGTQQILQDSSGNSGTLQNMVQALTPYGVSQKTFQCPLDVAPDGPNCYQNELGLTGCNSSYIWGPYSEDQPTVAITKYSRRGGMYQMKLSRVVLASDWRAVHGGSLGGTVDGTNVMNMYAVYADGHASSTSSGLSRRTPTAPAP